MKGRIMKWVCGWTTVVLLATGLMGCIAAVPLVIKHFSTPTEYVATAEVRHPAGDVYNAVIRDAEGSGTNMKIVKRDDAARVLEISDGVQTATVKVVEETGGETQIIVAAGKAERERQKELALQVLLHLCKSYGDQCRVEE